VEAAARLERQLGEAAPARRPGRDPRHGIVHHVPDGAQGAGSLTRPVHPRDGAGDPRSTTIDRMVAAVESGCTAVERRQLAKAAPLLERLADLL
jgi:hypothetical protein